MHRPDLKEILAWTLSATALASVLASSMGFFAQPTSAVQNDAGPVLLVRHADAPGKGEPIGFSLKDCTTQRNLNDKGRRNAERLGATIRASRIAIGMVLSSEWCRARETAQLLDVGQVHSAPEFDDLAFNGSHSAQLLSAERKTIEKWHGPSTLLIVTHSSNIAGLTDLEASSGAIYAVRLYQGHIQAKPFSFMPRVAQSNSAT